MTDMISRIFTVALNRTGSDQRTVGGLCVPYGVPTAVSDDGITMYREMFARGAFRDVARAANRIPLTYRHGEGLMDQVGQATQLDEADDGLHGMFRVVPGAVGDHALVLVDEGMLTGLSISGVPLRTSRNGDGVVVRQKMHLESVGLCEQPAYPTAMLSVRRMSRSDLELPERPPDEQMRRLAAIGIRIDIDGR